MNAATFAKLDEAAEAMHQVATELEAAAALVGAGGRITNPGPAQTLVLTGIEAQGFSLILGFIAGQLRTAETQIRTGMAVPKAG